MLNRRLALTTCYKEFQMQIDKSAQSASSAKAAAKTSPAAAPSPAAGAPQASSPQASPPKDQSAVSPLGTAMQSLSLTGATMAAAVTPAAAPAPPPLRLLGLKQGDKLEVDGLTTADGVATVKQLEDSKFDLQASINIPYVVRGLADNEFTLKDGKVNLSITLTREGDQYRYRLLDNNANGKVKGSGLSKLEISEASKTETGFWGGSQKVKTQSLSIDTPEGKLTIKLKQDAKGALTGSVSIPGLPSPLNSFGLEKQ